MERIVEVPGTSQLPSEPVCPPLEQRCLSPLPGRTLMETPPLMQS